MLLCAKQISGTANFEIPQRDFEPGTKRGVFFDGRQSFFRDLGQHLCLAIGEVCVGTTAGTSDTPADLVQLGKAVVIGVFDDERVRVRNVDPGFDDRRAYKEIHVAFEQQLR